MRESQVPGFRGKNPGLHSCWRDWAVLGGPLSQGIPAHTSEEAAYLPRSALPSASCPGQRARQDGARGVWEHWTPACPCPQAAPQHSSQGLPLTHTDIPQSRQKLSITQLTGRLVPLCTLTSVKEWRKLPKADRNCRSIFPSQRGILVFIN